MKITKIILGVIFLLMILIAVMRSYGHPDFDTVKREFLKNENAINNLVEIFHRESKVVTIRRNLFGKIGLTYYNSDYNYFYNGDYSHIGSISIDDENLKPILKERGMSAQALKDIVEYMSKAEVGTIYTITKESPASGESIRHIEIQYPERRFSVCSWYFLTPVGVKIDELAKTVGIIESDGDEGPYIVNEKWLTYKRCPA